MDKPRRFFLLSLVALALVFVFVGGHPLSRKAWVMSGCFLVISVVLIAIGSFNDVVKRYFAINISLAMGMACLVYAIPHIILYDDTLKLVVAGVMFIAWYVVSLRWLVQKRRVALWYILISNLVQAVTVYFGLSFRPRGYGTSVPWITHFSWERTITSLVVGVLLLMILWLVREWQIERQKTRAG